MAEPYSRSSRPWLTSLAVAGLACATVATAAQGTGQFHWWAVFILIPAALIAASGGPLLARGGGRAFAGYMLACIGTLVFAVGRAADVRRDGAGLAADGGAALPGGRRHLPLAARPTRWPGACTGRWPCSR